MNLTDLSQYFFSGLTIGCIYALVALGFVIIANVTQVYNFAQGEYVMIGAMVAAGGAGRGWSLVVLVPLASLVVGVVALVQERLTVAPVRLRVSPLTVVVGTLGVSVILRGLALMIWDEDPLRAPVFVTGTFTLFGARLSHQAWIVWAVTAASLIAIVALFKSTAVGRAMRACAINPTALRLLGVRAGPLATGAFVLSGLLAGLVGAVTVPITLVRWDSGVTVGLVAFIAAAIGGFTSPLRTVAAGLALGVIESMASGLVSSQYRSAYVYGVLVVYLLAADAFARDGVVRRLRARWSSRSVATSFDMRRPALFSTVGGERSARPRRWAGTSLVPPVLLGAAALVPLLVQSPKGRDAAVFAVLSAIAASGLVLVMGLANQISLGQGAFMLIGGYAAAILTTTHGWNLAVAAAAAVMIAAVGALVIGALALRLTGFNLAIATLGMHLILLVFVTQRSFTGGTLGVTGIPPLRPFGVDMFTSFRFYYVALAGLVACLWIARNLWRSRIGRSLRALGADEAGTRSLGVRAFRLKLVVFVIGGAMGGLAGVLWAYFVRFAAPSTWDVALTIDLVTYVIVGGLLSAYGGAVGAAVVSTLLYLATNTGGSNQGEIELVLSGLLLVLFVLVFRDGLVVASRRLVAALRRPPIDAEVAEPTVAVPGPPTATAPAVGGPGAPVVQASGISKRFGALIAVEDVDIELVPGVVTALVGPNGAGKSTIVNLVSGVLVPTAGGISVAGRTVLGQRSDEIARLGLARTFQTPKTFGSMTAVESVMLGRDAFASRGVVTASLSLPAGRREDDIARAHALRCLEQVGLEAVADRPMSALPAGHQRLVDVARAMALEPYAVLLDEPAAGLDHTETAGLGRIIRRMADAGVAVLLVEHDMRLVMDVADRVVVVEQGRTLADGTPGDVVADQRVIDAYLGVVPV